MNLKHPITIVAIDRAEAEVAPACRAFEKLYGEVNAVMLVNKSFTLTPAYKGDENEGYFSEIIVDFNDEQALKIIVAELNSTAVVVHCRMEEALKDYQTLIPLLKTPYKPLVESLSLCTEKTKMRKAMSEKFPEICPRYAVVKSYKNYTGELVKDFNFPVIIKPNGLHSSFLVVKCHDKEELRSSLKNAFEMLEQVHRDIYGTGEPSFLIEEFMEGQMYSMDGYVDNDKQVYLLPPIRVVTSAEVGKDGFYCYRSRTAIDIDNEDLLNANNCAKKALDALKVINSAVHIELYKTPQGWKIVEVASRIGGGRQLLYWEAYGVNHFLNDLLIHYGKQPNMKHAWERFASGFNVYADKEGIIESVEGMESASVLSSTLRLGLNIAPGGKSVFASHGGDFIVDGNMSNDDLKMLDEDFYTMIKTIRITVTG